VGEEALYPPPSQDPETVRQATDALLAEKRFREGMGLRKDEDLEAFIERLQDTIASFVTAIIDLQVNSPLLYWGLVVGLILILILLVWHIIYTVRRGSAPQDTAKRTVADIVREADLGALWVQVREAEAAGDLGQALRIRFAIAVARAIGLERLRGLGHLTYRELVAAMPATHPRAELERAVGIIEDTYYAGNPLAAERYRSCVDAMGREESS